MRPWSAAFYVHLSSRSDHGRYRWHTHLTNYGYFDYGKNHKTPQFELHVGIKMAQVIVYLWIDLMSRLSLGVSKLCLVRKSVPPPTMILPWKSFLICSMRLLSVIALVCVLSNADCCLLLPLLWLVCQGKKGKYRKTIKIKTKQFCKCLEFGPS